MRRLVKSSQINVIGYIWMPNNILCAITFSPNDYDVENMRDEDGNITRDSVQDWLDKNAGDFSRIVDFDANIADGDDTVEIFWKLEDSLTIFLGCFGDAE